MRISILLAALALGSHAAWAQDATEVSEGTVVEETVETGETGMGEEPGDLVVTEEPGDTEVVGQDPGDTVVEEEPEDRHAALFLWVVAHKPVEATT